MQWLTGGILLSRDREYVVLYRGKDFLSANVSAAIEQQRNKLHEVKNKRDCQSAAMDVQNHKPGTVDVDVKTESSVTDNNPLVPAIDAENSVSDQKKKVLSAQRKLRPIEEAVARTNSKLSLVCSYMDDRVE